jgi:competence protein ComK
VTKIKENYEINTATLAILPLGSDTSVIYEEETEYTISKSPVKIINESCKYYGSSYRGRSEGTKRIVGYNYKAPIIVEESKNLIFFPTSSPRLEKCAWISLNNIKKYEKSENSTIIIFNNNKQIRIPISYFVFENQILRSTRLQNMFLKNKQNL